MVNIIGCGLAGSFIAKQLELNKIEYRIFDSNEKFASSKISENLFSMTWLKGHPYLKYSIDFLSNNYNIINKQFNTNKSIQNVLHIPISNVLKKIDILKKVTKINNEGLFCNEEFYKGINIICAGYYSKNLINIKDINSLTGHGFLFEPNDNNNLIKEVMRHYRPFVHEKIMKWHTGEIWYGDSTAIMHQNYLNKQNYYINESLKRISKIGLIGKYKLQFGARPFINNDTKKFGYYKKINQNNYVITGGWKDGMIIYPYLSSLLIKDINK